MAIVTKAVKGTQDILPSEVYKNQFLEQTMLDIAGKFGFREIRTPVFEHTELFQRGVDRLLRLDEKFADLRLREGRQVYNSAPRGNGGRRKGFS